MVARLRLDTAPKGVPPFSYPVCPIEFLKQNVRSTQLREYGRAYVVWKPVVDGDQILETPAIAIRPSATL